MAAPGLSARCSERDRCADSEARRSTELTGPRRSRSSVARGAMLDSVVPALLLWLGACAPAGHTSSEAPPHPSGPGVELSPERPGHHGPSAPGSSPSEPVASAPANAASCPELAVRADSPWTLAPDVVERLERVANGAVERREVPGAVVVVVRRDGVVLRRAFGARALVPRREAMSLDTLFDLASLTKPLVTATLTLQLAEEGRISLGDPIARWLPEAVGHATAKITIEQLLHHRSGLPAANRTADLERGRDEALRALVRLRLPHVPGSQRLYSDVGYMLLGMLLERVTGRPLAELAERRIVEPLGASFTFRPAEADRGRVAPTEPAGGELLRGVVHDPRARALGGVAGHAGLFGSGDDVARFARMLLAGGSVGTRRVLPEAAVSALAESRPDTVAARAPSPTDTAGAPSAGAVPEHAMLGAPVASGLAHSGYTGSYLWIDLRHGLGLVVLTSRLHPTGQGSADRLRRELVAVASDAAVRGDEAFTLAGQGRGDPSTGSSAPAASSTGPPLATQEGGASAFETAASGPCIENGIDVLVGEQLARLRGRRVALLTHAAGRARDGSRTIDRLAQAPGVTLVRLLSPEHGMDSSQEGPIGSSRDAATGLPIVSLYGPSRRPQPEHLADVDTIVVDLQDVGTRFYTYETTLGYVLEAASAAHKRVLVLDRPNPLGGSIIEGAIRDPARESFVAYHTLPIRHGLTMGELARLFCAERKLSVDLEVVPMRGWSRAMVGAETGLPWRDPSPNLRSPQAALLYPGIGLLEHTNVSVGRGTLRPFEWVGAPWLDAAALRDSLEASAVEGVRFVRADLTPTTSTHAGQKCRGVAMEVTDARALRAVQLGITIAVWLQSHQRSSWQSAGIDALLANAATLGDLRAGRSVEEILSRWRPGLEQFAARRSRFLLY